MSSAVSLESIAYSSLNIVKQQQKMLQKAGSEQANILTNLHGGVHRVKHSNQVAILPPQKKKTSLKK